MHDQIRSPAERLEWNVATAIEEKSTPKTLNGTKIDEIAVHMLQKCHAHNSFHHGFYPSRCLFRTIYCCWRWALENFPTGSKCLTHTISSDILIEPIQFMVYLELMTNSFSPKNEYLVSDFPHALEPTYEKFPWKRENWSNWVKSPESILFISSFRLLSSFVGWYKWLVSGRRSYEWMCFDVDTFLICSYVLCGSQTSSGWSLRALTTFNRS